MASNTKMNTVVRLRSRPEGRIEDTDLEVCTEPMPIIEDGQVLVQHIYLSLDPTHRIWMSDRPQYMDCVAIGDVMRAAGVGIVRESKLLDEYPVGSYVSSFGGICDYCVGIPNVTLMGKIDNSLGLLPLSAYCSIMTMVIGLTGWYGTRKLLNVQKDDIVVVSAASGAVGSLVGQLSKLSGAKVIGIAGGPAKCQHLLDVGFDVAIDYKSEDVGKTLATAAPDGITCYFDNVGGAITDAVLLNFQNNGRMAVCGSISEYEDNWNGIQNFNMTLMRRLTIKGFSVTDHVEHLGEALGEISQLLTEGKLQYEEDVRKVGLDKYVATLNDLYCGKNTGKLMMQINEEN
jgi:NADPH-dependent curcumin reductase CurA